MVVAAFGGCKVIIVFAIPVIRAVILVRGTVDCQLCCKKKKELRKLGYYSSVAMPVGPRRTSSASLRHPRACSGTKRSGATVIVIAKFGRS